MNKMIDFLIKAGILAIAVALIFVAISHNKAQGAEPRKMTRVERIAYCKGRWLIDMQKAVTKQAKLAYQKGYRKCLDDTKRQPRWMYDLRIKQHPQKIAYTGQGGCQMNEYLGLPRVLYYSGQGCSPSPQIS